MVNTKFTKSDIQLIKTGDCLLVRGNSWLSKTIRWFTKSDYNHAGIFWWSYDVLMVIEEDTTGYGSAGLIVTPFTDYLESKKGLLVRRPIFEVDGSEYGRFMQNYFGKLRYSFWDLIVAQPIYQLSGKKIWVGGKSLKDGKTVCSGWVYFVYNNFTNKFTDWFKKSPADLAIDINFIDKFIRN